MDPQVHYVSGLVLSFFAHEMGRIFNLRGLPGVMVTDMLCQQ